jgi:hypothetical protein
MTSLVEVDALLSVVEIVNTVAVKEALVVVEVSKTEDT